MRLIDADELLKRLGIGSDCLKCKWDASGCADRIAHTVMRICSDIKDTPTVEAVPVVRCKDCKNIDESWSEDGYAWCKCRGWRKEDYYCADGERRTE